MSGSAVSSAGPASSQPRAGQRWEVGERGIAATGLYEEVWVFGRFGSWGARSCRARFLLLYSRYLSPNTRPTWIVNASSESCMDHVSRACSSSSPPPQFVTRCPRGAASEARPLSVRVVARKGGRGPQRVVFDARGSWITAGGTPADPFASQWIGAHHASYPSSTNPIMLHALMQIQKGLGGLVGDVGDS
jgi:hypothetical protein